MPRQYKSIEEIASGDIVRFSCDKDHSFGSSIIVKILNGQAYLVRPMMHVLRLFDQENLSSPLTSYESYNVPLASILLSYEVFTTGPSGEKHTSIVTV